MWEAVVDWPWVAAVVRLRPALKEMAATGEVATEAMATAMEGWGRAATAAARAAELQDSVVGIRFGHAGMQWVRRWCMCVPPHTPWLVRLRQAADARSNLLTSLASGKCKAVALW